MANEKYVVVNEHDGGGVFCYGIYDDYDVAIGVAMRNILDFKQSYTDEGDVFDLTEPYRMEGDGGDAITVTYKAAGWENAKKDYYYVLFTED